MYHPLLQDHFNHPRNKGRLSHPTVSATVHNPLCGDQVTVDLIIKDGMVTDIAFEGHGCVISQASASIMTQVIKQKTIAEVRALTSNDVQTMIQLQLGPNRLRCAMLALEAIRRALNQLPTDPHDQSSPTSTTTGKTKTDS